MLIYRNWVIMDLASLNFGYELSTTTILCICVQQGSGESKFGLIFHLNPYFVYANSKDSGEFAYMHGSPESSLLAISSDFGKQI